MKKYGLILLVVFWYLSLLAQPVTGPVSGVGVFISPTVEMSEINGDVGFSSGIGGGITVGNYLFGLYEINTFQFSLDENGGYDQSGRMEYRGIWTGYRARAVDRLYLYAGLKAAWGYAQLNMWNTKYKDADFEDRMFVLTPEVGVEWNLSPYVCIGLTSGFRWIDGLDVIPGVKSERFSSLVSGISLKFGILDVIKH